MLQPAVWQQLPEILPLVLEMVDTDMPPVKWFMLGATMFRVGQEDIDARLITREMTNPFTTSGGAQVLGPNWEAINPIMEEMFGR